MTDTNKENTTEEVVDEVVEAVEAEVVGDGVDDREKCIEELNAVLAKYSFRLVPMLNLVPVTPVEAEDIVSSEENDEGEDS